MVFELPVTGERVKPQQVTALHLFSSLAFVGTGVIIFTYNYEITYWGLALLVVGLALILLTIFKNRWVTQKKISRPFRILELLIAIVIGAYSYMQHWTFPIVIFSFLSATILYALYWERGAGQKMFVRIDETGVKMPANARKGFILWHEIEQVILRYGVLSIDCLDNKLYQFDVSAFDGNIITFEEYCAQQVAANTSKRRKDDW